MPGIGPIINAIGVILLAAPLCPGFDGKNSYVYESAEQEASSTHVLLGKIRAFHPIKGNPGQASQAYAAELEVARVEKGSGVQPGDVVYVRFHSPVADVDLQYGTPSGGCYEINFKITPGSGHDARVYALLNDDYQYVADYPASFYRISLKHLNLKRKDERAARTISIQSASLFGSLAVTIALVAGYAARGWIGRERRSEQSPIPSLRYQTS